MPDKFYITTTLPYVNAEPHIGFGLEIVTADVIARYHKMLGEDVVFNTGTDEHGQKVYQKAIETNKNPQDYVDFHAQNFAKLKEWLNIDYTHFIRTTDERHQKAAREMWRQCEQNGDIYKKNYQVKYCVGCELEITESELKNGRCPLHPNQEIELRDEENYFFRFSKYQQPLLDLYQKQPDFVSPASKMKEIASFVKNGLKDFSISRLKEKMPWGVPVPGDEKHVMYVWFDALTNYISTLGWPDDEVNFESFWPGIQIAGKDNLRQQSAMWQAMLMSAGLPNSKQILINGFISVEGQKMSKSLGNVIAPKDMVKRYGTDATRWLLMELGPISTDMDVSWNKFDTVYHATLSNGLGNVCSRVAKLGEKTGATASEKMLNWITENPRVNGKLKFNPLFVEAMKANDITTTFKWCNEQINLIDAYLSENKPWLLEGEKQKQVISVAIDHILELNHHLKIFMPSVAEKIEKHFAAKKITALKPLFPRINTKVSN